MRLAAYNSLVDALVMCVCAGDPMDLAAADASPMQWCVMRCAIGESELKF